MTASISRADVVGGHDGRAEIQIEITYDNGGTATITLDEQACLAALDRSGVSSIDELVGRPWSALLPAFERSTDGRPTGESTMSAMTAAAITTPIAPAAPTTPAASAAPTTEGVTHARSRHP